jgi:hypothetical protein
MNFTNMGIHQQRANAGWGGPPSRTRRERITSSLLGKDDGEIRCLPVIRVGFAIRKDEDAFERLQELLVDEGYGSLEDLKASIVVPDKPYICRPYPHPECRLDGPPAEVLRHALILGLCTAQLFDPQRPVIWTRSSLTRVVELFDPVGFYQ